MNEWSPPQSVEYRAPASGLGVLRKALENLSRRISALEGTAPLKQAGVRGRPGLLSSLDYDGDGTHADLGTAGWMLGGDPAFLALHGVDVYADLAAKDETILGLIDDLAATQVTLAAQVADLASRVSVSTAIDTFDTGSLPNDSAWHEYGAGIPITINVPTGRVVVTVGCGEASLNCGGAVVLAEATFTISGGVVPAYGIFVSRAYLGTALAAGEEVRTSNSLSVQRAFVVTPGTYTITGKMRAWASGTATASVQFGLPYLTVQVTG